MENRMFVHTSSPFMGKELKTLLSDHFLMDIIVLNSSACKVAATKRLPKP